VLQPIWTKVTETATRIRSRIELILDWAKVKGLRTGDNPARWKGHLDKLLPRRSKVQKVKHHPALPYNEMASFMVKLRKEEGVAARALEFVILTCTRTTEARKAEWPEISDKDTVWTVPEGRMKGEREHRIPLSSPATTVLKMRRKEQRKGEQLIFPSTKPGKALSENAMLALLGRMGYDHVTVHGFRSTFRDWAAECTEYADAVAEVALSHVNDDETEAAYKRSDLFEKRRALMNDWAAFCALTPSQSENRERREKAA
jgi:integrase